jgi:hypothetical protein
MRGPPRLGGHFTFRGLLDANYRRVPGRDQLGCSQAMSMVVHASGCAPTLLYVLLYGLDTCASRQLGELGETAASQAPLHWRWPLRPEANACDVVYHRSYSADLPRIVRGHLLASAGVGGGWLTWLLTRQRERSTRAGLR